MENPYFSHVFKGKPRVVGEIGNVHAPIVVDATPETHSTFTKADVALFIHNEEQMRHFLATLPGVDPFSPIFDELFSNDHPQQD